MGVIEHSEVIENAVTLGGGTLTPPVTLAGTDPTTAPLSVVQTDSGATVVAPVIGLTHRLTAGAAAAGLGVGLLFRLDRDDLTLANAGAVQAAWIDPAGTGELRLLAYDGGTTYVVRVTPTGVFVSNASAEPALPINGGVLYVDAGALKYKGSAGTVTTVGPA